MIAAQRKKAEPTLSEIGDMLSYVVDNMVTKQDLKDEVTRLEDRITQLEVRIGSRFGS